MTLIYGLDRRFSAGWEIITPGSLAVRSLSLLTASGSGRTFSPQTLSLTSPTSVCRRKERKAEWWISEAGEAGSNEVRVSSEADVRRKLACVNPLKPLRGVQADMTQQPSLEVIKSTCDPLNAPPPGARDSH